MGKRLLWGGRFFCCLKCGVTWLWITSDKLRLIFALVGVIFRLFPAFGRLESVSLWVETVPRKAICKLRGVFSFQGCLQWWLFLLSVKNAFAIFLLP